MSDAFYWPVIDLLLWGLTSVYFRRYLPSESTVVLMIVAGIVFWLLAWRAQYEITVNLLEELWNKNLVNLFVSPLTLWEWVLAVLLVGLIKGAISFIFASLVAFLLYKVNLFVYGFYFLPLLGLLIISGWWIGFMVAGVIFRYGTKFQTLAWTGITLLSPFSAIYYPLSILPSWAQKIAAFIPTSYIFEAGREIINQGVLDWQKVFASLVLSFLYLLLSLIWVKKSFEYVLVKKGLAKVS
jgi:ABC-2 type transport system permease protein